MKATLVEGKDALNKTKGAIYPLEICIYVTCPSCGLIYGLDTSIFNYDEKTFSIGPTSIKLINCGWHGYMRNGEWIPSGDSKCAGAS